LTSVKQSFKKVATAQKLKKYTVYTLQIVFEQLHLSEKFATARIKRNQNHEHVQQFRLG
jgi:hypothetical protein